VRGMIRIFFLLVVVLAVLTVIRAFRGEGKK
jgi:hypothetical protein